MDNTPNRAGLPEDQQPVSAGDVAQMLRRRLNPILTNNNVGRVEESSAFGKGGRAQRKPIMDVPMKTISL